MPADPTKPISQLRLHQQTLAVIKFKDAWGTELPKVSSNALDEMLSNFVVKGVTMSEMGGVIKKVSEMRKVERRNLEGMIEKRFTPEQIHLFVHSGYKERNELTQVWQKSAKEQIKEIAAKIPSALGTTTKSVMVGGGFGCLVFIVGGAILGDTSFSESGRALLGCLPIRQKAWTRLA